MQTFPLNQPKITVVRTRRDCWPRPSSLIKSPIDSPLRPLAEIKVLIIHHAPLIRSGLVGLLEANERFAVCAQTDNAPTARERNKS